MPVRCLAVCVAVDFLGNDDDVVCRFGKREPGITADRTRACEGEGRTLHVDLLAGLVYVQEDCRFVASTCAAIFNRYLRFVPVAGHVADVYSVCEFAVCAQGHEVPGLVFAHLYVEGSLGVSLVKRAFDGHGTGFADGYRRWGRNGELLRAGRIDCSAIRFRCVGLGRIGGILVECRECSAFKGNFLLAKGLLAILSLLLFAGDF